MRTARVVLDDLQERYCFTDPAAGKVSTTQRAHGCRPSINVVAPDALGRIYWLYAWAKKVNTRDYIQHIFDTNEFWRPQVFGCEANAMQSLFADAIDIIAEERDRKLPLAAIKQPSQLDKNFRIRAILHPIIGLGKLLVLVRERGSKLPPFIGVPEDCLVEVSAFPMHPLLDVVDGLASACALIPPRRVQTLERSQRAASRFAAEMRQLHGSGEGAEAYDAEGDPFSEFRRSA